MIIRGPRPQTAFTVLSNAIIRDAALSWRARGILVYLLSMPDGWSARSDHLANAGKEGRDAVRAALTELETAGYLVRSRRQDSRGRWATVSTVYDAPQKPHRPAPVENLLATPDPMTENPASDDPALKELPTRNDVDSKSLRLLTERVTILCEQCDGNGWTHTTNGVETCSGCAGARIVMI